MKAKIFLVSAVLLLFCASAFAGSVTRSLSSTTVGPGADLVVTLTVDVSGDESYYAIDELVPAGWAIKDGGNAATGHSGHLKWVVIQDAVDTSYTYTLTAPATAGQATISGTTMFKGMTAEEAIGGQTSVTVSSGSAPGPGPSPGQAPALAIDWTIVLAGIILIAIAALVLPRVMKK